MLGVIEAELGDPRRRGCLAVNAAIELAGKDKAVTILSGVSSPGSKMP